VMMSTRSTTTTAYLTDEAEVVTKPRSLNIE
jgi:hypothetical protein